MTDTTEQAKTSGDRRSAILAALSQDRIVNAAALAERFGVRQITVRRDLERLEQEGRLVRFHGGAVSAAPEPSAMTSTIGVLVPTVHYFWPGVVREIETEAQSHGLGVAMRISSYDATDELQVVQHLAEDENVRGLLLAPRTEAPGHQALIQWLASSGIPHVLVQRDASVEPHGIPLESVNSDRALGAALAVHHLVDLGHQRIGLIHSRRSQGAGAITAGWRAACAKRGLQMRDDLEWEIPESRSSDFTASVELVLDAIADAGVTGLLVQADPEALPIMQQAQARGIRVPEDLSVIAYDDEVAGLFSPPMTAISPMRAAIGQTAVDLLARRIKDPGRPVSRVLVNPQLVVRKSTGPAPQK